MKNLATLVTILAGSITTGYATEAYSKPQVRYVIIPDICVPGTVKLGIAEESNSADFDGFPTIHCQDDQQREVACTTYCEGVKRCTFVASNCFVAKLPETKEVPKIKEPHSIYKK